MYRLVPIFCLVILLQYSSVAQELNATITLQTSKVENQVDPKTFVQLQSQLKDFLNQRKWTSDAFSNEEKIDCKIFVDARGVSTLVQKDRTGILSSAQYEIYADWIKKGKVEVIFDQEKYPGFFAWVIPSNEGKGKVGVAGKGINVSDTLNEILKEKGKYSTIRKIFAPIWIKGPIEKFVDGKTVIVGDAAGQAKPTTAGGIFTSGMGGVFAGQAISKFLKTNEISHLQEYQKRWTERFGKEFDKQLLARKILGRLDNQTINKLFESITPEITNEISEKDDFDFHTSSIIKLLGIKGSLKTAQTLISGEFKKILG